MDSILFNDTDKQLSLELTMENVLKMKVADLKVELKSRGLSTSGIKTELVDRLQNALLTSNKDFEASSDDVNEDDVLADDVLLNDEPSKVNEIIEDIDILETKILDASLNVSATPISPVLVETKLFPTRTTKDKQEIAFDKPINIKTTESVVSKSITEKSRIPISAFTGKMKENEIKTEIKTTSEDEKRILRAKRFNLASEDTKLVTRAERFGAGKDSSVNNKSTPVLSSTGGVVNVEVLKKRTERFGQSVSKVIKEVETKDKLLKRKERFGTVIPSAAGVISNEQDKKKLRAQRFGKL